MRVIHDDRVLHACGDEQVHVFPRSRPSLEDLGNLKLCLNACPSVGVFVTCSGLGPGRPHSLPLVGGLYHAQRTSTTRVLGICPLLADFVLHSRL